MAFGDTIAETVLGKPTAPQDTDNTPNAIAEGAAVNTTVGITAHSTFANGNASLDYSLSADSSGGGFKIDQNTGVVTVADPSRIDFESAPGHVYSITVRATKNNNFSSEQTFTISVNDVAPSTPVDSNAGANTVLEGAANGTAVGVTASSIDVNGGAVTYSLTGDTSGGGFTINATTGVITVADGTRIDFESSAGHAYTVTAQASDGTLTSSQTFTINVGDVTPTVPDDIDGAANTVAEGAAAGSTVGITASAVDPNGPATTYSLIADQSAGGFTINASTGVVTVANPARIDFESSSAGHAYDITVQASNGVQTTSQAFTIHVTNVAPSAPTDSNPGTNFVAEGAANGTVVGVTAFSTDVNGPAPTYSLTGDTSGGGFAINATTGVITVADSTKIDFETAAGHAYAVTAQASDGTLTSSQVFNIVINDVAPSTPVDNNGAANSIAEGAANGSAVGVTAFSTDINGPGVTWSLSSDSSGGGFTINSTTGVITVADSTKIDYETAAGHAYNVTARASDGTLASAQTFTIAVTDIAPSAPTDTNAATNSVAEGAANGSTVGITASSVDPNGPATTYSLTNSAGGRFAINSSTGVVTVANGAAIDFETAVGHAYGITVQATNGALTTSSAFSIGVTDIGPSTPADNNGAGNSVFEGAANGTAVGITASSTDPGGGPAPTYSLTDSAGGRFAIDANTGIVTVANGAAIDFETAPGAGHSYGITVQATGGALSTTQNFSIGVGNVNEAPAGTDKAVLIAEDTTYTFSVADFGFTDPGDSVAPNSLLAVKMTTVPGAGAGTLTNNGVTVNAGDSVSAANIASGLLVFTPVLNASGSPLGSFTFQVQDNGGTANGGVDLDQSANSFTINATAVNDAPVNSVPGAQSVNEEATLTYSTGTGNAITISDVDVGAGNETVTLTVTSGALTLNGTAGLAFTTGDGTADSTMTFSGTVAAINTALNGLTYTGNLNFNGADSLQVSTSDNGNSGGGGTQSDNDSVAINVVAVNDAPAGTDKSVLIAEDTTYTFSVADFGFSDPNDSVAPNSLLAVKMTTVPGAGAGTLTNNGVTVNAGDSVSAANIASGLLVFTPVLDASGSPLGTFTFQVQDNGGTANGGVDLDQSANTFTINVNAGNDAPINSVPGPQGVNEEATLTFSTGNGNAITISDVDVGSGNETVTLTVTGGTLTLGSTAGLASFSNNGTSSVTLSGTVANVNAAMNGLTYTGNLNFAGADTLVVSTNDNGNTGNGGPQNDTDNIAINVAGVNDAPVNGIQGTQTVNEDTTLVFSGANAISISDVDAGAGNETVTLSVASGALTLSGTAGLAFTVGDGTADSTMTFSGTVAAINAALNGLGYKGNLNFNGSDALNITTNDNGNTGSGGAQSDADSITINVSAVNDAPVNGVPGAQTVNEDTNLVFSGANAITISDVDVGAGNETVTLSVSSGALTLNGTAGLAFTAGDGTADSSMTFSGTVAAINAALNGLGYQGNLNFNGSDTLNITTSDNGNSGNGGAQSDADSVTINVSGVNDAPVNGVPGAQGVNEEATLTFSSGNANAITISDADVGAGNETVTLSVAGGLLSLNGTAGLAFAVGDGLADSNMTFTGTVADINAALNGLTYTGNLNFAGADTLNITTNDNGNTGSGGAQSDADGITINVAGVNDAPVNGVPGAQSVNEDTSLVFTGGNAISISDVDVGAGNETVTLTVTSGALTLNGTAGLAFTVGDGTADSTMTFSGTVAAINAALNGLGYQGNLNFNGLDTLNITTNDNGNTGSGGAQSDADSVALTISAVNDAPTLMATGNNPNYVAGGVDLFSGVSASAGPANESSQLLSKLVLTATNVSGTNSDFLTIDGTQVDLTDLNSLTTAGPLAVQASVSVTGSTATVTITSTPGLSNADMQTLVDGLKYNDTAVNPGDPNHVVTLTSLQDNGGTAPGVDTATLNIMSTVTFDIAPTIVAGGTLNYTENDPATVIDSTIDITDPDNPNMTGATVSITGGFDNTQDVLNFTPSGGIGGSYNATTGVLTLTGSATQAQYETVLGTVTYQNTSDNPSTAQRTVSYVVNDGFIDSTAGTATINITAANDVPVVTASGGSTAYIENAAAVTVDGSLTVTDPDSSIISAQVRISANFQAGDSLNFANQNGISGNYVSGTGVLSLSGTASVADYQTALRSITFSSTNNDPGVSKTVEFKVNDAVVDSNLTTKTLAITPVNDEPTLTAPANGGGAVTFTETSTPDFAGSGPVDLFSTPATSTVEAGQTLTQVVITVTNVADTTEFLTIGATAVDLTHGNSEAVTVGGAGGTAAVSVSAGTATITVTPTTTFSAANVDALVDSLAYNNNDNTPTATSHTISVTLLTDSGANGGANNDDNTGSPSVSTVVTVTPTNDAPVAVNDTFTGLNGAITNTTLVVDGPTAGTADPDGVQKTITGNILANDSDVDGGPLTVVAGTFTTAEGGSVTLDTDGGFVYTPKPNTTGTPDTTDSFTYTVTDGNPVGQNGTATATVTINFVPNSTIWYVDGSYDPLTHGASDGSSLRPFTNFTQLNGAGGAGDVDAAGDTIFVYDGTYTGNLELESGQKFYGERHGLDAPDGGGAAGITTLVAANAGAGLTQINGTVTAAAGGNNDIQAISWGSSAGVSLTGTNVGALHVNDANAASAGSINNTLGGAVSINGSTAGMNVQFTSLSSGAGTHGILLTNALGTFNAAGGTLSGHSTSEVGISGGTGTITYGGVIGDGLGLSASIAGRTGGTVTLSGNINDGVDIGGGVSVSGNADTTINFTGSAKALNTVTGPAVSLSSNTGTSNVNFTGGGLDIDTTSGIGFSASSASAGNTSITVTGSGNSINATSGSALDLTLVTVGGGGINFDSTSSTNSTGAGVAIVGATGGAIALGSGSISGSDGDAFRVGDGGTTAFGGTSAITYSGSISKTDGAGQAVDIQDRPLSAGNITLSGNITHNLAANTGILLDDNLSGIITFSGSSKAITSTTAPAVNLTDNAGATIAFTGGGLVISSTSGNGFVATGGGPAATTGGTVTVEGSGNTITSTAGGTALNVTHTTIGTNELTFQSISASGGTNGIVLNNTGTSGGLNVTGTGAAARDGTGGTITGTSGNGVSLTNTSQVSLTHMNINNSGTNGVFGSQVNGFVSDWNSFTGNGNAVNEGAIRFGTGIDGDPTGLTGGAIGSATETRIDHTLMNTSFEHGLVVENTSGTLTQLNLTSTTIQNDVAGSGFLIETRGNAGSTAAATVVVTGSSFLNNPGAGINGNALRNTTLTINILGNTAAGTNTFTGHDTILLGNGDTGHLVTDIRNNTISGNGNGIFVGNAVSATSGATLSAKIVSNSVTTNAGGANHSISSFLSGGTSHLLIDSNTVVNNGQSNGINVGTPDDPSGPNFTAIVTNNTVTNGGSAANGISLSADVSGPGATAVFKVENNTVNWSAPSVNNLDGIFLNQFGTSTVSLERGISASNNAAIVLAANNPNSHASGAGGAATTVSGTVTVVNNGTITAPLLAALGGVAAASPAQAASTGDYHLTQAELDSVVAAAIAQWAAAGASASELAALRATVFSVVDLSDNIIADEGQGHIRIDIDAAGHGWFVDPTPNDNSEFTHAQNAAGTDLLTDSTSAAAGHMDLLTAVSHELGHVLGLADTTTASAVHDLMYIDLVDGERRLPDATDVSHASAFDIVQTIEAALPASAQAAAGTPIVAGTPGNDTIDAGHGGNILLGGGGADNFVFGPSIQLNAPTPAQITHVADYSAAQGDTFDFSALTSAFHNSSVSDSLVVRAVEDASGKFATLQVDHIDPMGLPSAPNWVSVAQLDGAHAGDAVNILIDNHHSVHLAQIHVDLLV
jgi:hypothetical protein